LTLRLGRRLHWPDNYFRILWNYRLESLRYFDFRTGFSSPGITDVKWPRITSATGFTLTRDSRDLSQFATKGSLAAYSVELAGGPLGGFFRYHKHIFEASKYLKVLGPIVLVGKAKTGVIDGGNENRIPYTERFSPGGVDPDGIIRGYIDGSIGPKYSNGTLRRGRSELIYNLALQIPVIPDQIYTLAFADAGNAWLAGYQVHPFSDLKTSAGLGFRVVVPGLGTIGFDFGYGFSKILDPVTGRKIDGHQWRPHFQIGSAF
jgi:outer membrane protein insertion porin family